MENSNVIIRKVNVEDLEVSTISEKLYDYSSRKSEINSLTQSIKEIGLREPIIVIPVGIKYIIIDGVLRFYAVKNLNLNEIDAIVVDFVPSDEFSLIEFIIHHHIRKEKTLKEKENEIRELLRIDHEKSNPLRNKEERVQLVSELLGGKGWGRNNVFSLEKVMKWEKDSDHDLKLTEKLMNNEVKMKRVLDSIELIDSHKITKKMEDESKIISNFLDGVYDKSKTLTLLDNYKSKKSEKPTIVDLHPIKKENFKILKGNIENIELPEDLLVDTIFTSPPYYQLIKYGPDPNELGWEKNPDDYVKRLSDILMKCLDKLKETGNMFVNLGETYKDKQCLGIIDRLTVEMMNRGVRLVDKIIWNKPLSKPVGRSIKRFYPGYEVILHFSKSRDYYFDNFKIQRNKKLRVARGCKEKGLEKLSYHIPNPHGYFRNVLDPETLTNVITLQIGQNRTKHVEGEEYHPATFSMDLPLLPLLVSVPKSSNSTVMDPFMGTGSTGVTALKLGFKFIGVELYEKNIVTAQRMLSENQVKYDENKIDDIINKVIFGDKDDKSESLAA